MSRAAGARASPRPGRLAPSPQLSDLILQLEDEVDQLHQNLVQVDLALGSRGRRAAAGDALVSRCAPCGPIVVPVRRPAIRSQP